MIIDIDAKSVLDIKPQAEAITNDLRYGAKKHYRLDLRMLTEDERKRLLSTAKLAKAHGWRQLEQALATMALMKADPGGTPIKKMREAQTAIVEFMLAKAPRKWLFRTEYGHRMSYYVDKVVYVPTVRKEGWTTWEHVIIMLRAATTARSGDSIRFELGHIEDQPSVTKLLGRKGLRVETPQLVEAYTAELERYDIIAKDVGGLFAATGTGLSTGSVWYSQDLSVAMERDGVPSKVVVDDGTERDSDKDEDDRRRRKGVTTLSTVVDNSWWVNARDPSKAGKPQSKYINDDEDDEDDGPDELKITKTGEEIPTEVLPKHPWVSVFDIMRHQFLQIHSSDLEPWEFDDSLGAKLVLPESSLEVLSALTRGADAVMEDIVKGKTGGTIILCTGDPGLGKTLSAEVFAEMLHKPLYTVQCSQLGMDPAALEKELGIVLDRANRWKCILLIDEADVYVRSRGNDIVQNAMVGVWLRVLEYYRGVLFMTSNKATEIDDAVMSRATAWIRYERPTADELERIWAVLLAQYEMETPTSLIPKLVEEWPRASGRNVKNLIKLARQLKLSGTVASDFDMYKLAGKFLDIAGREPETRHIANALARGGR